MDWVASQTASAISVRLAPGTYSLAISLAKQNDEPGAELVDTGVQLVAAYAMPIPPPTALALVSGSLVALRSGNFPRSLLFAAAGVVGLSEQAPHRNVLAI